MHPRKNPSLPLPTALGSLISTMGSSVVTLRGVFALRVPCARHVRTLRTTFSMTFPDSVPKFTITQ